MGPAPGRQGGLKGFLTKDLGSWGRPAEAEAETLLLLPGAGFVPPPPPPPPPVPSVNGNGSNPVSIAKAAFGAPPRPDADDPIVVIPRQKTVLQRILQFEVSAKKIKPIELMHFCRYMSVFLAAGIPILDALETVRNDTKDKTLRTVIGEIAMSLRTGENFSTAIEAHHRALPNFFVSMVRAAEETGQLAVVLGQMAEYIDRDVEAKRKTKSALVYPAIVVSLSFVSIGVLIGFVLPRFVDFFESFNAKLPLPTRILVWISKTVQEYGPFVGGGAVLLAILIAIGMLTEQGKFVRDTILLRTPVVRKVVLFAVVERFCRILSSMVQAGVPLPVAIDLASKGGSNQAFGARIAVARRKMVEGAGLSTPLDETGLFPPAAIQMLRVGEETGSLEARLEEISTFYAKELSYKLKRLTDLLEPISVVIVGVLVGFVAIAIISAIYGVFNSSNIQGT